MFNQFPDQYQMDDMVERLGEVDKKATKISILVRIFRHLPHNF
jgi:hypothetical protein